MRARTLAALLAVAFGVVAVPLANALEWEFAVKKSAKIELDAGNVEFEGDVDWYVLEGRLRPDVAGILTIKNLDGQCARMRVDFLTGLDAVWSTWQGAEHCAGDAKKHEWKIRKQDYSTNKITKVRVTLERRSGGSFTSLGPATRRLGTVHREIKIAANGIDFGSEDLLGGAPWHPGDLAWSVSEGRVTAKLTGTLHIDNATGACARLKLTYRDDDGDLVATREGGTKCASDNGHFKFPITLGGFGDHAIAEIRVSLQSIANDGSVRTVGSATSSFGGHQEVGLRWSGGSGGSGDPYR